MALELSPRLKNLASQTDKTPQLILEIEGSQYLYGTGKILETARWDDPRINWDNNQGITWDGQIEKENSRPYISLKGSTRDIAQQLFVEKGGAGSITTMNIALVDYNKEVARDLSFDQIGDVLGRRANVYFTLEGGRFPQDTIELFKGQITDTEYRAGLITLTISNPADKLRNPIFESLVTQTTNSIDSIQTTIPVGITNPFIYSQDAITSYIRIDDEIMEVVSSTSNSFEVIRSRLGTIPTNHDLEADVQSYYILDGHPIDLALKLYHSNEGNTFKEIDYYINALNQITNVEVIEGAIVINDYDIQRRLGLVEDDEIELIGTASNDGIYKVLTSGVLDTGKSYIRVKSPLSVETGLDIKLRIRSKYNVLSEGVGLDLDQVNTAQFEETRDLFSANFIHVNPQIEDTIDELKSWVERELFRPQGIYNLPNVRLGCKYTAPPFSVTSIPTFNTKNLKDVSKIVQKRSGHKYLTNYMTYRYNADFLTGKLLDKLITQNLDSTNRIDLGKKKQSIDVKGIRRSGESKQILERATKANLSRFKFASRYIKNIKPLFSNLLTLEIGDVVFFGGEDTQLTNLETGERDNPVEIYEVINTKKDYMQGSGSIEILQTGFAFDGLVGVFSPSSKVISGSTTERILLDKIWDGSTPIERDKWTRWIGAKIRVHSDDYTFDETTTLDRFDTKTPNGLILDPPLSSVPPANSFVNIAKLENYQSESDVDRTIKLTYTFTMPSSLITNVIDSQNIDVEDASQYEIGMEINVRSIDFIRDSETVLIDNIVGNTLTFNEALDITPEIGDRVEVYSFSNAKGYRFL